ncbi:MAG TPA: hypothetical protein EYP59_04005 [Thiotrichaceae bacterium]|nr:hypothetical protein [Thiotrichaceae bacterium]
MFVAAFYFLHTFAYQGMGILDGGNANLATQLWISARYLESTSLLMASLFALKGRQISPYLLFTVYLCLFIVVLLAIFWLRIFPITYVEGSGLTRFKVSSEFIISARYLVY